MQVNIEINKDFKPRFIKGLNEVDYHADKTKLNSSLLKHIFKSPRSFAYNYANQTPSTKAMEFGKLMHHVILEGADFLKKYIVEPEFLGFTKDGKLSNQSGEARDKKKYWHAEMEAQGRLVVTQADYDKLNFMVDSFMSHPFAYELVKNGITELTGHFADPETGIVQRIRPDFMTFDARMFLEFKSVTNAELNFVRRRRIEDDEFRYDLQLAMYNAGIKTIAGKEPESKAWVFIESEPPYETVVYEVPEGFLDAATDDYHIALRKIVKCIQAKDWPGMQTGQTWMFPSDYYAEKQRKELWVKHLNR